MMAYDYRYEETNDIIEWIKEHDFDIDQDDAEDKLYEELWIDDSVTGNASGSYTFSRWKAEENLCHNTDLMMECLLEFSVPIKEAMEKGAEYIDVSIRCYLLGECIHDALERLRDDEL